MARELAVEQRDLELVANEHVQVVGSLVSGDAVDARRDDVDRAVKAAGIETAQQVGERALERREVVTPKRGAAADMILPEPRLRLVHAHARRVGEQRAVQLTRQPLVVERVAAFVQRREDRPQRIVGASSES